MLQETNTVQSQQQTVMCHRCGTPRKPHKWCKACYPPKPNYRKTGARKREIEAARLRAQDMADKYVAGATLQEIGDYYGITRERVRQLMTKYLGVTGKDGGQSKRAAEKKASRQTRRAIQFMQKWGMSEPEFNRLREMGAVGRYQMQKRNALRRGIHWNIALAEWWALWEASGKWDERGQGGYGMARHSDTGAYEVGNVKIIHCSENSSEFIKRHWKKVRDGQAPKPCHKSLGRPIVRWETMRIGETRRVKITAKYPHNAAGAPRQAAKKHGMTFEIRRDGDHIEVTRTH